MELKIVVRVFWPYYLAKLIVGPLILWRTYVAIQQDNPQLVGQLGLLSLALEAIWMWAIMRRHRKYWDLV
jgi:hypothetical protein